MSDLRAQNLAICAVLYGIKPTSSRFGVAKSVLSEAVADLVMDASHPFFAGLRESLKTSVGELGVEGVSQRYHIPIMLAEMLILAKDSDERSTQYTSSPVDSQKSGQFGTPIKANFPIPSPLPNPPPSSPPQDPTPPVDPPSEPDTPSESDPFPESSTIRKRSHKARLAKAVELYKQGVSAELLADKFNISNKYTIHLGGNWSQFPIEKVAELGRIQYAVRQLWDKKGYTLKQVEKVFEDQPRGVIKVMYQSAVAGCGQKRRKVAEE